VITHGIIGFAEIFSECYRYRMGHGLGNKTTVKPFKKYEISAHILL